jgi:hypothetical protein
LALVEFSEVERALAVIHDIPPGAEISFRGRINTLKAQGVVRSSGGRGKRLDYDIEDVWILAFCLELHEFEIGPAVTKRIVEFWRPELLKSFRNALRGREDLWVVFKADMLQAPSKDGEDPMRWIQAKRESDCVPKKLMGWLGPRFGLINLSLLRRQLDAALPALAPHAK